MPATIHVIGDSHSSVFTGLHGICNGPGLWRPQALPGFEVWHLGPILAFSIANPMHEVRGTVKKIMKRIGKRERVLFCFGEIDCRNHLVGIGRSMRGIPNVASEVAESYAEAERELAGRRPIAFVSVPPPTVTQHGNKRLPTVGSFKQRTRAVGAFNASLHATAKRLGAAFLDTHDALAGATGEPNPAYFADGVHADPRALPVFLEALRRIRWIRKDDPAMVVGRALAMAPPPGGAPAAFPGRLDNPDVARALLIGRAALECKAEGARRIALMGAGQHTRTMGIEPFRSIGLRVVAILDDRVNPDKRPRKMMHGVPVMSPDERLPKLDAVVISSDAGEWTLEARALQVFSGTRVRVVPIYRWPS